MNEVGDVYYSGLGYNIEDRDLPVYRLRPHS